MAAIKGPYTSFRSSRAAPALFCFGATYKVGALVRHGTRRYAAVRDTIGAPGLEPDHNSRDWQAVDA